MGICLKCGRKTVLKTVWGTYRCSCCSADMYLEMNEMDCSKRYYKCPDCGCRFISKKHHVEFYCPNCRNWKSVNDLGS